MQIDAARQKLFADLVEQAIVVSRQLISLLEAEYQALTGTHPAQLQQIVEEKKPALVQISNVMAEQASLLSALELSHDANGVDRLYANLPDDHPWRKSWQRLQVLARNLAEHNLRNGILLNQQAQNTRRSLDILTGNQTEQPVYQYGGRQEATRRSNSLAYA